MQAVTYRRYGSPDVLAVEEVPAPTPGEGQVLVEVRAVALNRSDWETLTARPRYIRFVGTGLLRPKQPILGSDVAGVVAAVGPGVTTFRPGDEVLADTLYFGHGGFAEYVVVPERAPIVPKPPGLSFEDAAALPQAAVLAHQGLHWRGPVSSGQRVAIVGAGGGGGTFAVQIAKAAGAEVTGVDHTRKLDLMRGLGADRVVDYTREDYTAHGPIYDRILDFAGARSVFANRRALAPGGVYYVVGASTPRLLQSAIVGGIMSRTGDRHLGILIGKPNKDDLAAAAAQAVSGVLRPVIDRTYPLAAVADALRRLGAGEALGKLVVTP